MQLPRRALAAPMSLRDRRHRGSLVPMIERWTQAYREGGALLESFTQPELDCVAIDPDFLPVTAVGPSLRAVGPSLADLGADQIGSDGNAAVERSPSARTRTAEQLAEGEHMLTRAAARLEQLGYLRPGFPAPATDPVPPELAGWSANLPGQPAGVRSVAISGDLGIVTRMRTQPYWVAEVSASPKRRRPELLDCFQLAARAWPVVGRIYAAYRPLGGLAERPPDRNGKYRYALL